MQLHIVLKLSSKDQNHVLINAMNRPVPFSQQKKNFLRMNYAGAVSGEYNVCLFLFVVDWHPPSNYFWVKLQSLNIQGRYQL